MSTTLVIPCYNEEARLDVAAIRGFLARSADVQLLLVDDGSTDSTRALLEGICAAEARCRVLALPQNRGKAEAVRAGMLEACRTGATYTGYWDADLATPLDAVEDFRIIMEKRPQLELVLGSRVQLLGRAIERSRYRHYVGRVFATAVSLMLGLRVYDTQCGAKLFRVTPSLPQLLAEPFGSRWVFDVEIIARLIRQAGGRRADAAARLYELPLVSWRDVHGSKVKFSDGVKAFFDLARIWRRYLAGAREAPALVTGGERAS